MFIENPSKHAAPAFTQTLKDKLRELAAWHEGDVIDAELLKKIPRHVFFDIGALGTGIVYGAELSNARELLKKLKIGDRIPAKIVKMAGEGGYVELSLSEADEQRLWQQAKELMESGEVIKVKIGGANAGGLTTSVLDLKAFLPVSRLSSDHYPKTDEGDRQKLTDELKKLIGEELSVKIIDINPRAKKLIVSERETLGPNVKELLSNYTIGQTLDVLVSGIADFGVFVKFMDNPQIEGMIHVSELDHKLVTNPKEIVTINQVVKAQIIDIREGRVFLSLKALVSDPWEKIEELYAPGQEVAGIVYKFNPFGAVVNITGDIQGIIHVSEFGGLEEMKQALTPGSSYQFVIESIKPQEKRLILKLKK